MIVGQPGGPVEEGALVEVDVLGVVEAETVVLPELGAIMKKE